MIPILLQMLPFFALIGLGYGAVRTGFFSESALGALTKFVFWFALTAMLFHFAADLSLGEIFDLPHAGAYILGTAAVNMTAIAFALWRGERLAEAAVEGQCSIIGNTGFLGIPLLLALMGPEAIGPIMMMLTVDLVLFGSVFTILVTLSRAGRITARMPLDIMRGLATNPMIVAMAAGLLWAASGQPVPDTLDRTVTLLAGAATPGALFAIGGSLALRGLDRPMIGGWLSCAKLILHPGAVGLALLASGQTGFAAQVMVATAALPVAGNVYMVAQYYGVAPQRVSTSILISTVGSLLTLPLLLSMIR